MRKKITLNLNKNTLSVGLEKIALWPIRRLSVHKSSRDEADYLNLFLSETPLDGYYSIPLHEFLKPHGHDGSPGQNALKAYTEADRLSLFMEDAGGSKLCTGGAHPDADWTKLYACSDNNLAPLVIELFFRVPSSSYKLVIK